MGDRTRSLRRVRVRRDSGASRGTHLLIGSISPMGDDDTALWGGELSCSETGYSPECVEYEFCELRLFQSSRKLASRHYA
jgi:hypothetical protein